MQGAIQTLHGLVAKQWDICNMTSFAKQKISLQRWWLMHGTVTNTVWLRLEYSLYYRDKLVAQAWLLSNATRHIHHIWTLCNTCQETANHSRPPTQSGWSNRKPFWCERIKNTSQISHRTFPTLSSQKGNQKLGFIQPIKSIFHSFQAADNPHRFVWEPLNHSCKMPEGVFQKAVTRSLRHKPAPYGVTGLRVQATK